MRKKNNNLGGILLVPGPCIGAGMIGVPVKTAAAGFYPTMLAFLVVWIVMTLTALLFMEISLAFKGENNFISMVKAILGDTYKNIAWFVYILLMYSIMAAYTSGGITIMNQIMPMNYYLTILVFLLPFAFIVYLGSRIIDFANRLLTIGLIVSFILLCAGTILFDSDSLQSTNNFSIVGDYKILLFALPILVTTFGYHMIIPSLKSYLQDEIMPLKKSILIGGAIPLIVYVIWQLVILLLIPVLGDDGLLSMLLSKKNPADSLINYLMLHGQNKRILVCIIFFSFCALTSSLIGVAWALGDFLADGLKVLKNTKGKIFLSCLTFIPPVIYSVCFPQGFLKALGMAGVFCSIITIIYPALMVLKLRNKKFIFHPNLIDNVTYKAPISNKSIIAILLFGVLIVVIECINNI